MKNKTKSILSMIKTNVTEYYTIALITVGLPVIAFVYADWRLALTVFIVSNIVLGVLSLRYDSGNKGE